MKFAIVFVNLIIIPVLTQATCSVELAIASGKYLIELENSKLQEYQGGGACVVLDSEIKKCSNSQKVIIERAFDVEEVLGNICMPHLPPPPGK